MSLVLDTSVLINLEKGKMGLINIFSDLRKTYPSPPAITFISYFEFLYGVKERNAKNKDDAISFIELFTFLNTSKKTAVILRDLKHKYEKPGNVFSLADLLIASQVIENSMILVTSDRKFGEITEMKSIII